MVTNSKNTKVSIPSMMLFETPFPEPASLAPGKAAGATDTFFSV